MSQPHSASTVNLNLRYVLFLASTAALGGLLFGFDIAIITGAGPFLAEYFRLNDLSLGVAFSSLLFGCALGSVVAGRLTDLYGRRKILLWVSIVFALTSIATGLAASFSAFLVARCLGGLAVGGASVVSPLYVSEISPPSMRGRMGTLYQLSIILGILLSYTINYLLRDIGPSNWRWMFITGALPALVLLALLVRAPETPRFLVRAGRHRQAYDILQRISGTESADLEILAIRQTAGEPRSRWRDLMRPGVRTPLVIGFCLAILIHVSGINTVIDYAPAIFRSAGWKIDAALFSTFIVGLTNLAFTLVSFWIIDRFGRKPLYMIGSLGMAASLLLLTLLAQADRFNGWPVLLLVLLYLAFFASCIGPVFWTLVPEIFPNRVRGTAMTVPVLTQWIANACVVLFFPVAFHQIGKSITFAFLASMCVLQAAFTAYFVPETKNRTLEEVDRLWAPGADRVPDPHAAE